jgi:LmbE family N-acetylglucosaminyl deacetylase
MKEPLRLLAILAHPDDESLGFGGTLAKYANEGIETYLITATRGERGRFGDAPESPGLDIVGKTRTQEVLAASKVLGIKQVHFLNYIDGDLDKAPAPEVIDKIARLIREIKPQVVLTFDPYGGYGHPDHIAISQFSMAGVLAANSKSKSDDNPPWKVSKFYYRTWPPEVMQAYETAFKKMVFNVDGKTRKANPWPSWSITTKIDTSDCWEQVWEAVNCHQTQISIYNKLKDLPASAHQSLWGKQSFYRVFSMVNGGRKQETDIFEGLRK